MYRDCEEGRKVFLPNGSTLVLRHDDASIHLTGQVCNEMLYYLASAPPHTEVHISEKNAAALFENRFYTLHLQHIPINVCVHGK